MKQPLNTLKTTSPYVTSNKASKEMKARTQSRLDAVFIPQEIAFSQLHQEIILIGLSRSEFTCSCDCSEKVVRP